MRNFIISFALMSCVSCVSTEQVESSAKESAASWCQDMGLNCTGYSCSGKDSDADGYTSCTVAVDDGTRVSLDCGYYSPLSVVGQNTSCRQTRAFNVSNSLGQ